jgi:hypothetical protein
VRSLDDEFGVFEPLMRELPSYTSYSELATPY